MARESKKDDEGKDEIAMRSGKRIRACRQEHGWSQEELAKQTGYVVDETKVGASSPSSIGMYEQGRRRIGFEEAEVFAKLFPEWPHPAYFMGVITDKEARVLIALGEAPRTKLDITDSRRTKSPGKEEGLRRTGTRSAGN